MRYVDFGYKYVDENTTRSKRSVDIYGDGS